MARNSTAKVVPPEEVVPKVAVHNVVAFADCDETPALKGFDKPFKLEVKYISPRAILFRLSIRLTDELIVYLHLEPDGILSLHRTTCRRSDHERIPHFNVISQSLNGILGFTRLQFELKYPGKLITPKKFVPGACDTDTERKFKAVASFATVKAFSLYMKPDVLTTEKYEAFNKVYQSPRVVVISTLSLPLP